MILLTQELKDSMPKMYTHDTTPTAEIPIAIKFYTPDSNWTWYVTEGEENGDDYTFFGLVDGVEREWGYFSLNELKELKGPLGLKIERDLHFENKTIGDI